MKKIKGKKNLLLYGCSGMGVNLLTLIVGSYLCNALRIEELENVLGTHTYLGYSLVFAGLWMVLKTLAKALDGFIDLPFAFFTDRIKSKFGRRKTGLLLGYIPMVIFFICFLFPLTKSESLVNTIWFGVILCLFYSFYTLTMLTYYATFSEVCETEQDTVFLSNVKSVCDVVYFILGFVVFPIFMNMGINVRFVALIFLPLSLTMLIPIFMLKENVKDENSDDESFVDDHTSSHVTIKEAFKCSFANKEFIYWMFTEAVLAIGLQLFLGSTSVLFEVAGLNQTLIMAFAFAPVPLTIIIYNKLVKEKGLGFSFRYILLMFAGGMVLLAFVIFFKEHLTTGLLYAIAIVAALMVSQSIGSFFSINYTVPTYLAQKEHEKSGKDVATMYFAIQGIFEGVASGIATGVILEALRNYNHAEFIPIVIIVACLGAFTMSFFLTKNINQMGKKNKNEESVDTIEVEAIE